MDKGPRSKIDKYNLGEKVLRLVDEGWTIRKITEKLLTDGSIPSDVGVAIRRWGRGLQSKENRQRRWKMDLM